MFSARFVLDALTTVLAVISAAPTQEVETRAAAEITVCTSVNFQGTCVTISVVSDECINLTGGFSILNKEISSAVIPEGFICTFFEAFGCVSGGTSGTDEVGLEGNPGSRTTQYPDFTTIKGIFTSRSFNDLTSSISCIPL